MNLSVISLSTGKHCHGNKGNYISLENICHGFDIFFMISGIYLFSTGYRNYESLHECLVKLNFFRDLMNIFNTTLYQYQTFLFSDMNVSPY